MSTTQNTIILQDYWQLLIKEIGELDKRLQQDGKTDAEYVDLKGKIIEMAEIGKSMVNIADLRAKSTKMSDIEWDYLSPVYTLKLNSSKMFALAEVYYFHLCRFPTVYSNDPMLDSFLKREKQNALTLTRPKKLQKLLEDYRAAHSMEKGNYNFSSMPLSELSVADKKDLKDAKEKGATGPAEKKAAQDAPLQDVELGDPEFEMLDDNGRHAKQIELELEETLSGQLWPKVLFDNLNAVCTQIFKLDISKLQTVRKDESDFESDFSYISDLTLEALRITRVLNKQKKEPEELSREISSFIRELNRKQLELSDLELTLSKDIQTCLKEALTRAQAQASNQAKRFQRAASRTSVPSDPQSPEPPVATQTLITQTPTQSPAQTSPASPAPTPNMTVNTVLPSIPPVSPVGTTMARAPTLALGTPSAVSPQHLAQIAQSRSRMEEISAKEKLTLAESALNLWPEREHREYLGFLEVAKTKFPLLREFIEKFKHDLAQVDLKLVKDGLLRDKSVVLSTLNAGLKEWKEFISNKVKLNLEAPLLEQIASLSKKIFLIEKLTKLYELMINHDQHAHELHKNLRLPPEKCNAYFHLILDIRDEVLDLLQSKADLLPLPKENADRFESLAKNLNEYYEKMTTLFIEYFKLKELSPDCFKRTHYKAKFPFGLQGQVSLEDFSLDSNSKVRRPDVIVVRVPVAPVGPGVTGGASNRTLGLTTGGTNGVGAVLTIDTGEGGRETRRAPSEIQGIRPVAGLGVGAPITFQAPGSNSGRAAAGAGPGTGKEKDPKAQPDPSSASTRSSGLFGGIWGATGGRLFGS